MKKIVLLFTFLLISVASFAGKANPMPFTITQTDGSQLTIRMFGDEDFHWYATLDGVLLYREGSNYYVAKIGSDGSLQSTNVLAHEPSLRESTEKQLIKAQDKELFYKTSEVIRQKNMLKREPLQVDNTYFPCTGSPKAIVILVNFSDTVFSVSNPRKTFEQYLNGEGKPQNFGNREDRNYGSVKQYFSDMSGGQYKPQFDLYGPVKLPNELKYYGEGENMQALLADACKAMDDSLDFSKYDSNADGKIDLVYIIYAGFSESIGGNSTECIWPKSGTTSAGVFDGVNVARYGVNGELNGTPTSFTTAPFRRVNGIGLFCHEFSHCLGLPDFYPTAKDAQVDNQGMEYWSVMDGGEYLDNGYTPTAYTAWEREAMGWMSIHELSQDENALLLQPIDNGGKAYRVRNDADQSNKEYFIIENIQTTGWNSKQKGHGMIVYHVDYDVSAFSLWPAGNNTVNNRKGKPRMAIVPADGLSMTSYTASTAKEYYDQLAGDPFPGKGNVLELHDNSGIVNFKVYTGEKLNKAFLNISESDGIVSLKYVNDFDNYLTGIKELDVEQVDRKIYTLEGKYIGEDKDSLPKGIYIQNKRKIVVQ